MMRVSSFAVDPSEAQVAQILSSPEVIDRLGGRFGLDVRVMRVTRVSAGTYHVSGGRDDLIVRFPGDVDHLSALKREERVGHALSHRIAFLISEASVVKDLDGCPPFAIHRMILGEPLTTDRLSQMSPQARDRLVLDLASFFQQTHDIPLDVACDWLDIPFDGERTVAALASTRGKPIWFGREAVAEMCPRLISLLDDHQWSTFEDTVGRFQALGTDPGYMVFGHGDMHGSNMALGEDELGFKLVGAFDLGCAGILDVHEDLFRLSLISEGLLERVVEMYQHLTGDARSIDRDRIAVYYRAFLFYLMVGQSGPTLSHLERLLQMHLAAYDAR